ncbi:MAG: Fpg/Nei family DNA glycosylase [Acidimicrobiia bacterium]|nr:Fpg/Nei family DNA glycosylase [Acidimicrobiia bacterium]
MPEGDSYVQAAARIRPVLEGQTVTRAGGVPQVRRHAGRVVGATAVGVRTVGKHLLIDLSTAWTIHVWLGMPGRVRVSAGRRSTALGESRRRERHDQGAIRLLLETDAGRVEVWSAPTVEIERTRVIEDRLDRLGPDILVHPFDWSRFESLVVKADAGRRIGDILLDQRLVSGIGNVYRNEVLFCEGVHPLTPLAALPSDRLADIVRRAIRLMRANTRGGPRVTTGNAGQPAWVYDRAGLPCRRCGQAIQAAHVGSPPRITYWCPGCQVPERGSR